MIRRLFALACMAATLAACSGAPVHNAPVRGPWNGGVWNSVMGYHGPDNSMGTADGPN